MRRALTVPRSVAVVGASDGRGTSYYGTRTMRNLVDAEPGIPIYPVNPRLAGEMVFGRVAYASLADLPEVPDLVVITTPVGTVPGILDEAGRLGVSLAVVVASHQGDADERRDFDLAVRAAAATHDLPVIGPNSMGLLNGRTSLAATFSTGADPAALRPGNVAMLAQSGAVIAYLLQHFAGQPVGYTWLVSTGNEAVTSLETLLTELADDPQTDVIALFLEGVGDGIAFRRAALRARLAGKAVLALKVGTSETGKAAVQSHTGRMTGAEQVYEAVAAESGIAIHDRYENFFDAIVALSQQGVTRRDRMHRRRAAVLTTSGGAGTYTADRLSEQGWTLPPLSDGVLARIREIARQEDIHNPIDITGGFGNPERIGAIVAALGAEDGIDAVILATGAGGAAAAAIVEGVAAAAAASPHELYVGWIGIADAPRAVLDAAGIPVFDDPARAVRAAEASARFRAADPVELRRRLIGLEVLSRRTDSDVRWYGAAEALAELAAHGVATVSTRTVTLDDAAPAIAAGRELGFPVVAKIEASSLNHKSDAGGVKVGLADEAALAAAVDELSAVARKHGAADARVSVQQMLRGTEVLVGIVDDPVFGPVLVLGSGGVTAELLGGSVRAVLPVSRKDLDELIDSHAVLPKILAGYRGAPMLDRAALVDLLKATADWAVSRPGGVRELDLNPVIVGERGASAVDARFLAR